MEIVLCTYKKIRCVSGCCADLTKWLLLALDDVGNKTQISDLHYIKNDPVQTTRTMYDGRGSRGKWPTLIVVNFHDLVAEVNWPANKESGNNQKSKLNFLYRSIQFSIAHLLCVKQNYRIRSRLCVDRFLIFT